MKLYDHTINTLSGEPLDLTSFKGKKVLLVNVASECGLTPQYEQLQQVYEEYGGDHFVIIGIPSNDFMGQEPGTPEQIAAFCSRNYGVSFPLTEKVHVKGENQHPLFTWLCHSGEKGNALEVKWNFHKFLVDENGDFVCDIDPRTLPNDKKITNWINS